MQINTNNLREELAPLYNRYQTQCNPQPAYVELDCEEEIVSADWDGEIGGGVPFDVWHHRTMRVDVNECVKGDFLADLLESDEFKTLYERVFKGYSSDFNGQSNLVGHLDDDAQEAIEKIEVLLQSYITTEDCADVYEVRDWLEPCVVIAKDGLSVTVGDYKITAKTTDEELHDLASGMESEAEINCQILDGDMYDLLVEYRSNCQEEEEEEEENEELRKILKT